MSHVELLIHSITRQNESFSKFDYYLHYSNIPFDNLPCLVCSLAIRAANIEIQFLDNVLPMKYSA